MIGMIGFFDPSTTSVLLICLLSCVIYFLRFVSLAVGPGHSPPGPRGWKKTLKLLKACWDDTVHLLMAQWAAESGPVTFFYHLGQPVLLLNSPEKCRKLLGSAEYKNKFVDRASMFITRFAFYNSKDVIFTAFDDHMRQKRRLVFQLVSTSGDRLVKFERTMAEDIDRFIEELDSCCGRDIPLSTMIGKAMKTNLLALGFGETAMTSADRARLEQLDREVNELLAPSSELVLGYIPLLSRLPGYYRTALQGVSKSLTKAVELVYYRPKFTHIRGQPRGMADLLFDAQDKPGFEWMAKDHRHVTASLLSLFLAGHLATMAAVQGCFLCLLNHPKAIKKLQEEINTVLGERRPRAEDRLRMPYTEASVMETLRLVSQNALSGWRVASDKVQFDGFSIPKGTVVIINNWYFLHSEKYWDNPWTFTPDRFLDDQGQLVPSDSPVRKGNLTFGAGVRACPGEVFARHRIFLFITSLLQKFDFFPPVNEKLVPADFRTNSEEMKGFIRQVPSFKARLQRRRKE